jgi:small-conductance mechanosensitive channel
MIRRRTPVLIALVLALLALAAPVTAQVVAQAADQSTTPPDQQPSRAAQPPADPGLKAARSRLDAAKLVLDQIESGLARSDLRDRDLLDLRARIDGPRDEAQGVVSRLQPVAGAVKARLDQLGPKPADGAAAESADIAQERTDRERQLADLNDTIRIGGALLVQADQIAGRITERRRAIFASTVFRRSSSLLSPDLWIAVVRGIPHDVMALRTIGGDWIGSLGDRLASGRIAALVLALLGALAVYILRCRLIPRLAVRDLSITDPSRLRRAIAAFTRVAASTLSAAAAAYLVHAGLNGANLLPPIIEPIVDVILRGLVFVAFAHALADALFAADKPGWRLIDMTDAAADRLHSLVFQASTLFVTGRIVEAVLQGTGSSLQATVAAKGVFAVLVALAIANGLRRMAQADSCDEESFGPYVSTNASFSGPLRLFAWLAIAITIVAALMGYIAFSGFLIRQVVIVALLGMSLAILLALADEALTWTFGEKGHVALALQGSVGLTRRSLDQFGVLTAALVRVVLIVAAIFMVLAPWGVESTDLLTSLQAAFFGFKVGDVTISLSGVAFAIALFGIGLFVTRVVQRWLETRYLPLTGLDSGLRDSIRAATGYLGFFVAAALGLAQLGLSLDKIALVAGALSVGIGFGLQSIVNNFVSGLILLWERSIRIGDWVVVGEEQGFVRRINVRATEIETFDRASVIVPNSNFVSGVVKNWLHNNNTGRITITIGVSYASDPEEVAAILRDVARAHPGVLDDPEPSVIFKDFGASSLNFDLMCLVGDVQKRLSISSELRFAIFRAFKERGIEIPFPQSDINLRDIGRLEQALRQRAGSGGQADNRSSS